MSHCVSCKDVLYSVFIACHFCVLCCELSLLSLVLCVLCTGRLDKKIYSEFADSRKEKNVS